MLADEDGFEIVGEARSGEEVKFVRESPVGHRSNGFTNAENPGGLEATRKSARTNDEAKIICVTSIADDPYPSRGMHGLALLPSSTKAHTSLKNDSGDSTGFSGQRLHQP